MNKELEALTRVGEIQVNGSTIKESDFFSKDVATIEQALEHKEKLEKAIKLFHDKCDFVYDPKKKMWEFTDMEYFDEKEYELLKEVFGK